MIPDASKLIRAPWLVGSTWLNSLGAELMGIVNVTPDSFHDGGKWFDSTKAVERARSLFATGARIIDIGGESARPGSNSVPVEEELRRTLPVVQQVAQELGPHGALISIDTVKSEVARAAVEAGALIINDISNLSADPMMAECVAELSRERGAGVVLNHTRGTPLTMQLDPQYADAVSEVRDELLASANRLEELGMERERICLDPGIGFGKSLDHNLQLIAQLQELCVTGYPVLVGLSYKSLFGKIEALADSDRKIPSIAGAMMADLLGARVVRVHDVAESAEAFAFLNELRARGGVEFSPPFVISKNERG